MLVIVIYIIIICLYRFTSNTLFDISNEYPLCVICLVIGEVKKYGLCGGVGRAVAMHVPRV